MAAYRNFAAPTLGGIDLDFSDLQEIDAPLADLGVGRDEPTLTRIDFDDLELAFDFSPRAR